MTENKNMPEATAETTSVFRAELLNESDQQSAQSDSAVTGVEGLPEGQALLAPTVTRRLIADAIDMIVFIAGRGLARRVDTIARVAGLDPDGGYAVLDLTPDHALEPQGE